MTPQSDTIERSIRVAKAADTDLPVLANLYQFYRNDLAATRGAAGYDLLPEGRYAVPLYLASIGADPRIAAFLVWTDGALAGFALVRAGSQLTDDPAVTDMLDFFIARKYRGLGSGSAIARYLFARYPGRWEVRAHRLNGAAQRFWRRVIAEYTAGRYIERTWNDARHRGIAFGLATIGVAPTAKTSEHTPSRARLTGCDEGEMPSGQEMIPFVAAIRDSY